LEVVKKIFDRNKKMNFKGENVMPDTAKKIDGKKFMWDGGHYSAESEAKEKMAVYEKEGFETRLVNEESKFFIYTRRVVTEIILEEGGQPL
jgi:hypothetical protein